MNTETLFAPRLARLGFALCLAASVSLVLDGCTSPEARRQKMMERLGPPQRALAGQAVFFAGGLEARATLGAYAAGGPGRGGPDAPDEGGRHGGGRMMMSGGGIPGAGGGTPMGGGPEGGGMPGGEMPMGERDGLERAPAGPGGTPMATMPRHTLQVSFHNTGQIDLPLDVLEVKSPLGNFAPRPEKLILAPGQTASLEAMHSIEGATFDAMEVVVTLRSADRRETQTLRLNPRDP
jgi:hypothetical protein